MATADMASPSTKQGARIVKPDGNMPVFGCEHIQRILSQGQDSLNFCVNNYKAILRRIFDDVTPLLAQTAVDANNALVTTLTPTFLCLQCPEIVTAEAMAIHGDKKAHRFYADSQEGVVYCHMCDDFIFDPTLEDLRNLKLTTGSFTKRKRKVDELSADAQQEISRFVAANSGAVSCRANGLRGLYNAGATCYQNVVLQTFIHNPLIRNYYLTDQHSNCDAPYCLSCAVDDLFQEFYASESSNGYTPANILSAFWFSNKKAFANLVTTKEQDAHEFFQFLAEELHERNSQSNKRNRSGKNRRKAAAAASRRRRRRRQRLEDGGYGKEDGDDDDDDDDDEEDDDEEEDDDDSDDEDDEEDDDSDDGLRDPRDCQCIIHQVFYGKIVTTTTCQQCKGTSDTTQSFLDLNLGLESLPKKKKAKAKSSSAKASSDDTSSNGTGSKSPPPTPDGRSSTATSSTSSTSTDTQAVVPLPTSVTLQDCLDTEFIKSDRCEYYCQRCDAKQSATRQTSILQLPNTLCIQLKRFDYRFTSSRYHDVAAVKIDTPVHFSLELNMLPYTTRGRDPATRAHRQAHRACTYELQSIVVHQGDTDTGHYTTYNRSGDQWFKFNDHQIRLATKSEVLAAQAYLLFYVIRSVP